MFNMKLPKWLRRLPKYRKKARIIYMFGLHILLFFVVAHLLITYRQPVAQIIAMSKALYFTWIFIGTVGLILVGAYIAWVTTLLTRNRWRWKEWHYFSLLCLLGMGVPIFITTQAIHGIFYALNIDIEASGYFSNEYLVLQAFIFIYNILLIYLLLSKENKRLKIRIAVLSKRLLAEDIAQRELMFEHFVEENFMVWSEKNKYYKVNYKGEITLVDWDDKTWAALLDFGYIKINRWVYVKKRAILSVDRSNQKLLFRGKEQRIFKKMDDTKGFFRYFSEKIQLKNGILTFTKGYIKESLSRGENFGDG